MLGVVMPLYLNGGITYLNNTAVEFLAFSGDLLSSTENL